MKKKRFFPKIRRYIIAGLLVWLPILVTLFVVKFLVDILDHLVAVVPVAYQPETLLGFNVPGSGLVMAVLVVFFTGLLVSNFIGHYVVSQWDSILGRIPFVRSVHAGAKQVLNTVFSPAGRSFRKVLLVQYPREGVWSIAFQTGEEFEKASVATGERLITAFVPTTPNPTSGFLVLVPASQAIELDVSVDEGLKMVVSLGIVRPPA